MYVTALCHSKVVAVPEDEICLCLPWTRYVHFTLDARIHKTTYVVQSF